MRKGKLVHLEALEPVGVSSKVQQPWSDTYVRTSLGKKRWLRLAPTIIGTEDLRHETAFERQFVSDYPQYDEGDVKRLERAAEATGRGEVYFKHDPEGMPDLFVPERLVSRASIERAIAAYLGRFHGFDLCRFKWRRPRIACTPTTIPCADATEQG